MGIFETSQATGVITYMTLMFHMLTRVSSQLLIVHTYPPRLVIRTITIPK
jgi:hypothetical protein